MKPAAVATPGHWSLLVDLALVLVLVLVVVLALVSPRFLSACFVVCFVALLCGFALELCRTKQTRRAARRDAGRAQAGQGWPVWSIPASTSIARACALARKSTFLW